jgi:hypothetical protein
MAVTYLTQQEINLAETVCNHGTNIPDRREGTLDTAQPPPTADSRPASPIGQGLGGRTPDLAESSKLLPM